MELLKLEGLPHGNCLAGKYKCRLARKHIDRGRAIKSERRWKEKKPRDETKKKCPKCFELSKCVLTRVSSLVNIVLSFRTI